MLRRENRKAKIKKTSQCTRSLKCQGQSVRWSRSGKQQAVPGIHGIHGILYSFFLFQTRKRHHTSTLLSLFFLQTRVQKKSFLIHHPHLSFFHSLSLSLSLSFLLTTQYPDCLMMPAKISSITHVQRIFGGLSKNPVKNEKVTRSSKSQWKKNRRRRMGNQTTGIS